MVLLSLSAVIIGTVLAAFFWGLKGPPPAPPPAPPNPPIGERSTVVEDECAAFSRPSREEVDEAVRQVWILFGIVITGLVSLVILWAIFLRSSAPWQLSKKRDVATKRGTPVLPPREVRTKRIELDQDDQDSSSS